MSAREPSEAKRTQAAAKQATATAEAAVETPEQGDIGVTFEEMQAGYEGQIASLVTQIIQQNIIIKKLQTELTEKRAT